MFALSKAADRSHRDKTRVQMLAKMFPQLKVLCQLLMGPTLGFDTKQRNSFLIKLGVFYSKSKILTILFIVKYEKIILFDEFLVLLGPIISRFFACSNAEIFLKGCSLQSYLYNRSQLVKEVNCTESSLSVRVPWLRQSAKVERETEKRP